MRTGQVAGGADERVVVEDVEDAGYRLDDVVFTQFGVTTAAAIAGPIAAAPAFPEPASAAAAAPVAVVVLLVLVRAAAVLLAARALLIAALVGIPLSESCGLRLGLVSCWSRAGLSFSFCCFLSFRWFCSSA